jgi:acetyl-CoA carboxylase beta subunit
VGDVIWLTGRWSARGFARDRKITKQKPPPEASGGVSARHGMVDLVVHRRELRSTLGDCCACARGAG